MIVVSDDWCRMRMRLARLVSYAFLYTTDCNDSSGEHATHLQRGFCSSRALRKLNCSYVCCFPFFLADFVTTTRSSFGKSFNLNTYDSLKEKIFSFNLRRMCYVLPNSKKSSFLLFFGQNIL